MKKTVLCVCSAMLIGMVSMPSFAISAKHRQALEWSGCNMLTEANGTCDIHKSKAQNKAAARHKNVTDEAENLIGSPISEAADHLLETGWRPNNGDWHKGKRTLRLVVIDDTVVNAQIIQ